MCVCVVCIYIYLNAHDFQRGCMCLCGFFLFSLSSSSVSPPLCQCVFDTRIYLAHTRQHKGRRNEIWSENISEKFTLPFAINSKRRYIFGRNRAHILQIYGALEMHGGKMVSCAFFPLSFHSLLSCSLTRFGVVSFLVLPLLVQTYTV